MHVPGDVRTEPTPDNLDSLPDGPQPAQSRTVAPMDRRPSSPPFDARPLLEPVDRATARAYVQQLRQTGRAPAGLTGVALVLVIVVGVVFAVVFGSVFISILVGIIGTAVAMGSSGGGAFGGLFAVVPMLMLVAIVAVGAVFIVRTIRGGSSERWYRLDRFARANGMSWYASAPDPPLPGMIFTLGHDRVASDVVRGDRPRFVEFGNYRYSTGSGKNETTHRWGYVAVKLSSPLPHIVLDAVGNNSLFGSNLPMSFTKDQRLSLEGDFDRHFALYCPTGYESDALYLFTPDIMARFIDNAAALDVEIVDDWLFFYSQRDFSTLDPATWAWLFSAVAALLDKFAQWERWRDDRLLTTQTAAAAAASASSTPVAGATPLPFASPDGLLRPPPGVAPQGQRLKRGVPWGFIVVVGAFLVLFALGQFGVFGALLGGLFG